MTPAPNVGFNLTYVCPEGQVFEHDWFATPFVMMTCQVVIVFVQNIYNIYIINYWMILNTFKFQDTGVFDEAGWDDYLCVFRKYCLQF